MVQYSRFHCPFGTMVIGWEDDAVVSIRTGAEILSEDIPSAVAQLAAAQLREYFEGRRTAFGFPIAPSGTAFQLAVWNALMQIPYGETRTYGEIAAILGKPKATRAVGQAANRNPIWIAIPCHRVVGSRNALTGYAGGLAMKQALLELEQSHT